MHVTHLSLVDFRSYAEADVPLEAGVSAFVGRNGQGKTNLVEALGYAARLSSHRVSTDAPLVRAGAARAVVRVAVDRGGRRSLIELEINPGRANRARLNRGALPRPRDVLGTLRTVLFAPEDLALVKGDPDGRRRFLDETLVTLAPRLAGVQADYDRIVRQRNTLLRTAAARSRRPPGSRPRSPAGPPGGAAADLGGDPGQGAAPASVGASELSTLDVWDEHLAGVGAELLAARLHLVRRIAPHVAHAYAAVSGSDGAAQAPAGRLELTYRGSLPLLADVDAADPAVPLPGRAVLAQALLDQAGELRGAELDRGTTLVGPHRDDLLLTLDALPARGYASHGESWSCALALRLGTYSLVRDPSGSTGALAGAGLDLGEADPETEPVLILDDVFAELDVRRRERLAHLISGAEQVLITAAVDDDVPAELSGRRLRVSDGRVEG